MPEENTKPRLPLRLILFVVLPVLILSALLILTFLSYFSKEQIDPTSDNKQSSASKDSSSEINPNKEYSNPFEKETQYINPFSEYKNPFDQ